MATVKIQNTGNSFTVSPSQTVLEAAIESGINLPYGCRNGSCGSCKGKVISGKVTHDDFQSNAMSEAELDAGHALFCCARPDQDLVIEARGMDSASGIKPKMLPVKVAKKELLAKDVMALHLQLPSSQQLTFYAGQYIEFILQGGKRRAFSIANAPFVEGSIELHVRLVEGGEFTSHVFNELAEKAIMRIKAPLGSFYLRKANKDPIIFAATGTGFAPIKGIIEDMLYNDVQTKVTLYWGGRQVEDLYMHELCQRWEKNVPSFTYVPVLSRPAEGWKGRTGYVQNAVKEDIADLSGYQAYVCGLPQMVDDAEKVFLAQGLDAEKFFSDAFTLAPEST